MSNLHELLRQQEELARQIEQARQAEKSGAIAAALEIIRANNLTAKDLGFSGKEPKVRKAVAVQFVVDGQGWSGRGRLPKFIVEKMKTTGMTIDQIKEKYRV